MAESGGATLWRAHDPLLARPVGLRLVPLSDPRIEPIRTAARSAAKVHDRRVVEVLDVLHTDEQLAVVSEWVPGRGWAELLAGGWGRHNSAVVAYEVASALQSAHERGTWHGRLRPSSVIISDTSQVRLRGLCIERALWTTDADPEGTRADIHGVGCLLFAGLTGRWPSSCDEPATVDGLTVQPITGKRPPLPSDLVAGVPAALDEIVARSVVGYAPSRRVRPFTDMQEMVEALRRYLQSDGGGALQVADSTEDARRDRQLRRAVLAVIISFCVLAGVTIAALTLDRPPGPGPGDAEVITEVPRTSNLRPSGLRPFPVVSARDFDPQGGDQRENPDLVPLAFDGDAETAWTTVAYRNSGMDPKSGTGVLLDLGSARPIKQVSLQLAAPHTGLEVRVSTRPPGSEQDMRAMADFPTTPQEIAIRPGVPVPARYVLVWLTNLPYTGGVYQGGVAEVEVLG